MTMENLIFYRFLKKNTVRPASHLRTKNFPSVVLFKKVAKNVFLKKFSKNSRPTASPFATHYMSSQPTWRSSQPVTCLASGDGRHINAMGGGGGDVQ